jgi:sterol desaturase/sphingolipid hydroxylase (fatty acid hydroxylase superfamily)
MLHHKWFYKRFHKKHHEWTAPLAIAAAYSHPIEYIFSNMLPVSLGPILLGSHPLSVWMFIAYTNFSTVTVHSDYALPGFQKPHFHDFHHLKFNQNYGSFGVLDRIFETDTVYQMKMSKEKPI